MAQALALSKQGEPFVASFSRSISSSTTAPQILKLRIGTLIQIVLFFFFGMAMT
jgi:uncharacterized membrane protein YjfL (UPF0719 family)